MGSVAKSKPIHTTFFSDFTFNSLIAFVKWLWNAESALGIVLGLSTLSKDAEKRTLTIHSINLLL